MVFKEISMDVYGKCLNEKYRPTKNNVDFVISQ